MNVQILDVSGLENVVRALHGDNGQSQQIVMLPPFRLTPVAYNTHQPLWD